MGRLVATARPPLIVHITTVPQSLHGFFRGQIPFLRSQGFEVMGVCSPGQEIDAVRAAHGIEVFPISMTRGVSPIRDGLALIRLCRLFRRLKPTIVHSHTPKAGLLGSLAARIAGVPIRLYTARGFRWETAYGLKRSVLMWSDKLACACVHSVPCNSQSLLQFGVMSGVIPAGKAKVLGSGSGNGVDAKRFRPDPKTGSRLRSELGIDPDASVVGFVGRIVRDKGIVELALAWKEIRRSFPHAHLVLVGREEPEDPVPPEALESLRADPHVHFVGEQCDPVPYYAMFDLLVLPTYREGFPNAPLEAAAMELPVVATRLTGCVDAVVDSVTGILVPPRDPVALGAAIQKFLADPGLRRRMGQAGRERVLREFQPERIWIELLKEYCCLLEARGLPVPEGARRCIESKPAVVVPSSAAVSW